MQQIVNFILRNKTFLFFLLLLLLSVSLTIQSHTYHKSKFINSANSITGGIYGMSNSVISYFNLKEENKKLHEENTRLKALIYNLPDTVNTYMDSTRFEAQYKFTPATVVKNSYAMQNNVLLIYKGKRDGIKPDLGVISTKGIIGIIDNVNSKFSTVISILNTTNKVSAQLKKTNQFGPLSWNGKSPQYVQLTDIQKSAKLTKGDTIITSGHSAIFPKGILVGQVESFKLDVTKNYFEIEVKLFNDMTNLQHVSVIENMDKPLIDALLIPDE